MSTFAWFSTQVSRKGAKAQRARKKVFWSCATAIVAAAVALLADVGRAEIKSDPPKISWNAESGQAVLTNGQVELVVDTKSGINARSLRDVKTGQVYADRDYAWNLGGTVGLPKMEAAPEISSGTDGSRSIVFKGRLGAIGVEQTFTLPGDQPGVVLEQISISNPTDKAVETAGFYSGFAKCLREGEAWTADAGEVRFCPVPYRRETNGAMQEFPLREVAEHGVTYGGWNEPQKPTPIWGAEGWVWCKGSSSLLVAKYNQQGMEWSLMEPMKRGNETVLRFGGAGQWKYNHPEGATRLEPGTSYRFGETRIQSVDGDWKRAYYAYRDYTDAKGCRLPKTYDPPLQWNELYDNEYYGRICGIGNDYFAPGKPGFCPEYYEKNKKLLNDYYSLKLIKGEAAKAKDLGCEALYLDPGWEIGPSRQIWDPERLGPMPTFVKMLREEYGMRGVCFWCSLAGVPPTIGDCTACPQEARVINKEGKPEYFLLCLPSAGFLDTKEQNLLELAKNGAIFFMFDSNQYSGPCYDKTHGHTMPSTREEHAKALFELARRVKVKYPNVLIEMHDPITGPCNIHYTPSYFGYNPPTSFDCLWGHEFMWNSMDDLLSQRAVSLYYYNLAYSIPLYLHIGLNTDNENALVFWWYASTCRHLGVGGKSPNPAVWAAQKQAVQTYRPLKRFFTQGKFYGIDEMVHAHTLPELRTSVLNVFNLTDKPVEREVKFCLADVGLAAGSVKLEGAAFTVKDDEITMKLTIPARGHKLVKVKTEQISYTRLDLLEDCYCLPRECLTMESRTSCRVIRQPWCLAFGFAVVTVSAFVSLASAAQPSIAWNSESGQAVLTSGSLELIVETKAGINARSLRDAKTGQVYADRDYAWSGGGFPKMEGVPVIADSNAGGRSITFKGRLGTIDVEQRFVLPSGEPGVIIEQLTIGNSTDKAADTAGFSCGFAKHLREGETWARDAAGMKFCPVPYRRETNGQMQEFPLREVAERGTTFAGWEQPQPTPIWGAEGWVWSPDPVSKGEGTAFLIAKHNPDAMEWSLMEPVKRGTETVLRFGGAGQWKHGHTEGSARLAPGKSYTFGETRFQAVDGDWKQAFYAYRGYVDSKGCRAPKDYNPPVHWNELYDNEYFGKVGAALGNQNAWYTPGFNADNDNLLAQYYSRDLILAEAAKAKELGCEALYLDPGWDTGPSHHIWGTTRLGPMESFVETCKKDYGLKVSLWIGTGGMPPTYADPEACPIEARVVDKEGRRTSIHCFACPAYLDTKEKRLLELCRNGIAFMMFDSTQYSGPCCDKTHGHSIPSTREEHAQALLELTRRIKTKYPNVLIEMHDPISGPGGNHYTPTYFGYAKPHSFDCLWGHEFMWNSMDDLLSRRAASLYYYNLAYNIPLYLHVSLKPDNENAIVFWWFASTCRHLGMGGKSANPAVWAAHKKAMQTYLPLKRFYTQGKFYGIDEMVHAHTLPDQGESVINIFNLENKPLEREVRFRLADIGLPAGFVKIEGAEFTVKGDEITIKLTIPAQGHRLVKIRTSGATP